MGSDRFADVIFRVYDSDADESDDGTDNRSSRSCNEMNDSDIGSISHPNSCIYSHRILLACSSPFFAALLAFHSGESNADDSNNVKMDGRGNHEQERSSVSIEELKIREVHVRWSSNTHIHTYRMHIYT